MAQATEKVNKSQAIRDYLKKGRRLETTTPTKIAEALATEGIEITTGLASQVLYKERGTLGGGKKPKGKSKQKYTMSRTGAKKRRNKSSPSKDSITLDELKSAQDFSKKFSGGPERLKACLEALNSLQE